MGKIAIMTDSNSGITQEEGKEQGIFVVPMPILIDGEEYYEDITLKQNEFYEKLAQNATVSTSQPSIENLTKQWDQVLETYDEIIYIPMSSGLSGSCSTAMMLAEEYDGRVKVIDNQRISVTQRRAAEDAYAMAEKGRSSSEICEKIMESKLQASIYIMVDTLKYLRKGGRFTPAVAALGTLLRIKPILQIQGEKLDTFAKARTVKQGMNIMLDAMEKDVTGRFENRLDTLYIDVAHTNNEQGAEELKKEIEKRYPQMQVRINPLSLSVSCHIGPGSVAIAIAKKAE
ncbi:MAG: DegV family protein [Lachnospiraceae bacterium]|nr:DegV family protein [Lachnospiraceae bacterium]